MAALNNDVEKLEPYLDDSGLSLDQLHARFKLTPLQMAALNGSAESVALLLNSGADINLRSEDSSTALNNAAFMGLKKVVALLIEHGAALNPVNSYQSTPLDSTYEPWRVVMAVSRLLGLTVERVSWETGREEARRLLRNAGGKRISEL